MNSSQQEPHRSRTRQIRLGRLPIGGGSPVSVQTMTKTDTRDVAATLAQIREVGTLGCDAVRIAVRDEQASAALREIRKEASIPVVADIHFDHKLAIAAIEAGADGIRINPGNIGGSDHVEAVVNAARDRKVPIRIGVNSGSLEKDIAARFGGLTPEALVESALRHVMVIERHAYHEIKISVKASSVMLTVNAYRLLARKTQYPLHLGVTEAGTFLAGTVRSSVALGMLLAEGIGDTIRVSLTDSPAREVKVGLEMLRCLGLRPPGPNVISCPMCGRAEVDVAAVAAEVERGLELLYRENPSAPKPVIAVMGCAVNGPGEAREADIAVAGGRNKFALYAKGEFVRTVDECSAASAVIELARNWRGTAQTALLH